MCFSQGISASFFTIGTILTAISYKNERMRNNYFHIVVGFYTLMELLQTIQYSYVNECDNPINIFLTECAYLLVILQPLLWNTIFLLRTKNECDKRIFKLAIAMCIAWIAMNLYSRFAYRPAKHNSKNQCGFFNNTKTCTYRDSKDSHLYWKWTTAHFRDLTANYFMYMVLWFVPAMLVKEHIPSIIVIMTGCLVGYLLTLRYAKNVFEFPAIWCYISVPLVTIGFLYELYQQRADLLPRLFSASS